MYSAKEAGRNNFKTYSHGLNERADELLRMELHLKRSLESDHLILLYQPIVDINSGELIGVEALIRLRSPDGVLLSPTDFIPIAEMAGLINRIGDWVFREACRQHQRWRARACPPSLLPSMFTHPVPSASLCCRCCGRYRRFRH